MKIFVLLDNEGEMLKNKVIKRFYHKALYEHQ